MDTSPTALARILLPRIPLILKTAIFNALSLSKNSSKQNVKTETAVAMLRSILDVKKPLGQVQKWGLKDPGIRGAMWISKSTMPVTEGAAVRDALVRAIRELGNGNEEYTMPELKDVEGEWTGYRSGAEKKTPRPDLSEQEQYTHLMQEVKSDVTILYFHGGAYCLMDPSSHRLPTSYLAKLTKGRCFSVRYRLAPQNPFPAALLDALVAYLSLLSPAPGAVHTAVPAKHIIFAGDSAGGNLALVLQQTLLALRHSGMTSIKFNEREVPLELPAGLALNSPWCDVLRSMPSVHSNAHFDYLSPPSATGLPDHPADDIWPSQPPRAEVYCNAAMLDHPLVSPLAGSAHLWTGSSPVYICCGNEGLEDEDCIMARRLHQAEVPVVFDAYEGMPHCFAMLFMGSSTAKTNFATMAKFCGDAVNGTVIAKDTGTWMKAFSNPPAFRQVFLSELSPVTDIMVEELMLARKADATKREQRLLRDWKSFTAKSRNSHL
jgi:acetyl esterase/lipase